MDDLLACPFCAGKPQGLWSVEDLFHVMCLSCQTRSAGCSTPEAAHRLWNRRDYTASHPALKVFADFADALNPACPDEIALAIFADGAVRFGPGCGATVGDLRRARSALITSEEPG